MHRPRAGRRHRDEFLLIPRVSTEGHPPSSRRTNQRHGRNEPSGRGRKGGPVRGGGSVQGHRTPRRNLWQGGLGGRERAGPTVRTPRCNLCSAAGAGARARVRVRARCACARDEGAHSMKRTATRLCCVNDTKSANSSSFTPFIATTFTLTVQCSCSSTASMPSNTRAKPLRRVMKPNFASTSVSSDMLKPVTPAAHRRGGRGR